ncbi:unnamed protein product [Mytilus edulis]|uniref:Apple domain-containing protein n=1 Tax=Mytilus edulis TaxID=6550 RepID=A0A8S3RGV6_MYTED|nr:unnamed protein product [Mytilus edulis]
METCLKEPNTYFSLADTIVSTHSMETMVSQRTKYLHYLADTCLNSLNGDVSQRTKYLHYLADTCLNSLNGDVSQRTKYLLYLADTCLNSLNGDVSQRTKYLHYLVDTCLNSLNGDVSQRTKYLHYLVDTCLKEPNADHLANFDVEVIMPACTCNRWNSLDEGVVFHCHYQATASQRITITCPPNTRGRFVRIKRKDMKDIAICEVEVHGDPINSVIESDLSRTAYACGHIGYGYVGPVIETCVANSDVHCTEMCFTNTACSAAEYDKKTNVCILKGDCTNGTQSSLFQDNNKDVFFIQ